MTKQPSPDDVLGCQAALYEWAESYDTKDFDRLTKCIAPVLHIDYRSFLNKMWEAMPATEFVSMASSLLGDKRLKTQHFAGAAKWVRTSDTAITGYHQMRVAHQKYGDDELKEVLLTGGAHGMCTIWYQKVEGEWKFAGIQPDIRWSTGDQDKMFEDE
ncbi:Scytalone dehydratase [Lophiotrema nucula]|uniref:Scytalone dehydratase n=1 Tax=Lophiotrema nucula TaxID=690887 RepID=A0A6A5YYR0_9PLEO|nr:Scytalone dehydratase [Lophiotrema nucula]